MAVAAVLQVVAVVVVAMRMLRWWGWCQWYFRTAQVPLVMEAVGLAVDQTTSFITVLLMPLAVSIVIAIMTGCWLIAVFVKIDL